MAMAQAEQEEYDLSDDPTGLSPFESLKKLKKSIHSNSLFFDRLVDLVPARFYLPSEETANSGYHGMSKSAKAAARKGTKENLKKARRARLDPESYASTLELVKKNADKEQEKIKEGEGEQGSLSTREDNKSTTYEELRKRLHKRIEELQARRHTSASDNAHKPKRDKKESHKGKRKREPVTANKSSSDPVIKEAPPAKRVKGVDKIRQVPVEDQTTNLEFGRVKISVGNENSKGQHKKRKESKAQLLEKAKKLQSTMQDHEQGQVVATEHSWSAATSRAAGNKVLDNPKLLKQSLRKEKQHYQKSVQKWKERTELKEKALEERQQIRKEHIVQRNQQKKERLIAKREKKLLRPGFEGRKDGFINL